MRIVVAAIVGLSFIPVCVQAQSDAECLECHGEVDLSTIDAQGQERSLYTDTQLLAASVHADFACVDCHADVSELPHEDVLEAVDCAACHDDFASALEASVHGSRLRGKTTDIPSCVSCHGSHDIRPKADPQSRINPQHQPVTCGTCHADPEVIARNNFALKNAVALYEKSIHGELALQAKSEVATCSDCHTGHAIRHPFDPQSSIHKLNIPATCGRCHAAEQEAYEKSVHALSLQAGAIDAPVCTDCHGEHDILRPENPVAPTSGFNVAVEVCGRCHASERLARKYGFAAARVKAYSDSYHGLALRGGKAAVANCGSCHGVHDILPSTDPASRIHKANLVQTCGQCHPNATENFTRGPVHLIESDVAPVQVIAIVRIAYIVLIVVLVALMLVHNLVDFRAKLELIRRRRYGEFNS